MYDKINKMENHLIKINVEMELLQAELDNCYPKIVKDAMLYRYDKYRNEYCRIDNEVKRLKNKERKYNRMFG